MADGTTKTFHVNQLRKRDSSQAQQNHRQHQWIMLLDSFRLPNAATAAETRSTTPATIPAQPTQLQPPEPPEMPNTAQPPL
ncbi:unnamed protein product [Toxocara canis]|uniref:Uncharacterized protein n=1 Tax=Toxocara canis TaxID=6265 RepID=A0A183TV89_TOXCA|nr:unnamed protein product [Toxocara canis]